MRSTIIVAALVGLSACGAPQAAPTDPAVRANDTVLTLGHKPVTELNLPDRVMPCFALHFGLATTPADDIAADLLATCSRTANELYGVPCGEYARAAASLGESYLKNAAETVAAESAADTALKVCAAG